MLIHGQIATVNTILHKTVTPKTANDEGCSKNQFEKASRRPAQTKSFSNLTTANYPQIITGAHPNPLGSDLGPFGAFMTSRPDGEFSRLPLSLGGNQFRHIHICTQSSLVGSFVPGVRAYVCVSNQTLLFGRRPAH